FALDAILDAPVQLHDGSWSQTGKYSDFAAAGGELPVGSPWAIDDFLAIASYNAFILEPLEIESLLEPLAAADQPAPFAGDDDPDSDDDVNSDANQVEEADAGVIDAWTGSTVTFSAPVATDTPSVLIDPATLEGWRDEGLLDIAPGSGKERVVLLDVAFSDAYDEGHIPGAQFWNIGGQAVQRAEGPADAVNMVLPPEDIGLPEDTKYIKGMNTRLQEQGIDEDTTIVLTSSDSRTFFPSRAYFLFRYYGWPKDQIKVLDGYNAAWTATDRLLVTDEPDVTTSDLTVQDIGNHRPDLRVSLPELMDAIRDDRGTPVDFRGDNTATGSTAGVVDAANLHVVFEGRPKGGMFFPYTQFNIDNAGGDLRYKSAPEIKAALNEAGISNSEGPIYSYCRTGYIASTGFFVLDGILGWDVMTYDGSWSQWGKLSDDPDVGGELVAPEDSVWAVDNSTYMEVINYNVDNTVDVAPLNPDEDLLGTDPGDPSVNQVEEEDSSYQEEATGGDEDGGGAPTPVDSPSIGC
ncbi:MAG: selenite/tellurite reduction operon rhodanese-like protein ExtH, partial [Desulfuromonadales bacterium]